MDINTIFFLPQYMFLWILRLEDVFGIFNGHLRVDKTSGLIKLRVHLRSSVLVVLVSVGSVNVVSDKSATFLIVSFVNDRDTF